MNYDSGQPSVAPGPTTDSSAYKFGVIFPDKFPNGSVDLVDHSRWCRDDLSHVPQFGRRERTCHIGGSGKGKITWFPEVKYHPHLVNCSLPVRFV